MPFVSPNYTQTPNDLFDALMPNMGDAELRVVMIVVRETFGWHRSECTLSLSKMAKATGLSENGVIAGAEAAEKRGLIERVTDGRKSTVWRAIVSTSSSEVGLPQPVRQATSASEGQLGLKKVKKEKDIASEKNGRARPEQSSLQSLFSEATGLKEPQPTTVKERRSAAELWYQPIRRMANLANGTSADIMREAVRRMRKDGLTLACPKSVEKTFNSIYGEHQSPPDEWQGTVYR